MRRSCKREWFEGKNAVGVTAGASAPEELVQQVVARLREWGGATAQELVGREEHVVFSLPRALRGRSGSPRDSLDDRLAVWRSHRNEDVPIYLQQSALRSSPFESTANRLSVLVDAHLHAARVRLIHRRASITRAVAQ